MLSAGSRRPSAVVLGVATVYNRCSRQLSQSTLDRCCQKAPGNTSGGLLSFATSIAVMSQFKMSSKRIEPTERHVGGTIASELGGSAIKGYTEQDRRDMWRMGKKQELR